MPTIVMSRRRAILIALVGGIVLTSTGHVLAYLGRRAPGWTAGVLARIGSTLTAWPLVRWMLSLSAGTEPCLAGDHSPFVTIAALIAFPVVFWAMLVFLALLAGSRARRRVESGRPPSEL